MQNATDIFRKLDLPKKNSPGSWLRLKENKNIDKKTWKKDDDCYFFSDDVFERYVSWASPEEDKEIDLSVDEKLPQSFLAFKTLCDLIGEAHAIDYTNKLLKWFMIDQSYLRLQKDLSCEEPIKYISGNLDVLFNIYYVSIITHVTLSKSLMRNEIRNICNDLHKTFNSLWVTNFHNNIAFETKTHIYRISRTNRLQSQKKED